MNEEGCYGRTASVASGPVCSDDRDHERKAAERAERLQFQTRYTSETGNTTIYQSLTQLSFVQRVILLACVARHVVCTVYGDELEARKRREYEVFQEGC